MGFCIRFIRFLVWAHHMFSVGMDTDSKAYFSAATVVIGVPTRVKVFGWCAHLNSASIGLTSEVVWAVLFIWLFTLGGFTRVSFSTYYAWVYWIRFFVGVNLTFYPMHILRMRRFPRRYCSYSYRMTNISRVVSFGALASIFLPLLVYTD